MPLNKNTICIPIHIWPLKLFGKRVPLKNTVQTRLGHQKVHFEKY